MKLKVPPVIVVAITVLLMWVIDKYLPVEFPAFNTQKGIIILTSILGIVCIVLGVIQFSKSKTTVNPHKPENSSSIVKSGIYRYTRNPMYLGLLVILISCTLYFGNSYSFLMIPVFIWYMNTFQIKPEEEMLTKLFGEDYKEYQQKVRRWI